METEDYLGFVRQQSDALLTSARANLDAAVPSCPGWTVADLVAHIGGAWGWASAVVRSGERSDAPIAPDGLGGPAVVGWAEEQRQAVARRAGAGGPHRQLLDIRPPPYPGVLVSASSARDGSPRLGLHGCCGRANASRRRVGGRRHR